MFALDASAMIALMLREHGAEQVGAVVRESEMSIVNLAEVLTRCTEAGVSADAIASEVSGYGVRIRAFREAHAIEVAKLRPRTKHLGLSLGHRACLAQSKFSELPILTSDGRMAEAQVGLDIRMIR